LFIDFSNVFSTLAEHIKIASDKRSTAKMAKVISEAFGVYASSKIVNRITSMIPIKLPVIFRIEHAMASPINGVV